MLEEYGEDPSCSAYDHTLWPDSLGLFRILGFIAISWPLHFWPWSPLIRHWGFSFLKLRKPYFCFLMLCYDSVLPEFFSESREATCKFSFWPGIFFFFPLTLLSPGVSSSTSLKDLGCLVSTATTYLVIPKMSFFLPAISPVFFLIHMKSILKHILSSISMTQRPFTHAIHWCYQRTHLTLH